MERKNRNNNIQNLLSRFENGVELYQTNAVFAQCVEHLLNGGDVYKILEQVILMHSDVQKRYRELIESGAIRQEIVVSKERFEKLVSEIENEEKK